MHNFLNILYVDVCEYVIIAFTDDYCQISNISYTKSQSLNASRLVLQLSLPNLLEPCTKLRMKM